MKAAYPFVLINLECDGFKQLQGPKQEGKRFHLQLLEVKLAAEVEDSIVQNKKLHLQRGDNVTRAGTPTNDTWTRTIFHKSTGVSGVFC